MSRGNDTEAASLGGSDFQLADILQIIRRRKWTLIHAFVLTSIIGLFLGTSAPAVYTTTAQLLIDMPGNMTMSYVDTTNSLAPLMAMRRQESTETQLRVLQSSEFRERVMKKLQPGRATAGVGLAYSVPDATSIIEIMAQSSDPAAAAAWANVTAEEYVELTKESNRKALSQTREYLEGVCNTAKSDLDRAEDKLVRFKKQTHMSESELERNTRITMTETLGVKAMETENELLSLGAQIGTVKLRLAAQAPTLKELKTEFNPKGEAIQDRLQAARADLTGALTMYRANSPKVTELNTQISSLEKAAELCPAVTTRTLENPNPEYQVLKTRLAELQLQRQALEVQTGRLKAYVATRTQQVSEYLPGQVQLAQIQRERNQAEKTYVDYSEKLRDLNIRERATAAGASVIEKALVPTVPLQSSKHKQIIFAMILGLALGVGLAFLQEQLDDRINGPQDIERVLTVSTLGAIPSIPDPTRPLLTHQHAFSTITESYRALRTSLQYCSVDQPLRSLMVTSAQPGEGKSTTSANLAIAIALQGKRVILVDADMRQPRIHRLFGIGAVPGLTDVLAGQVSLPEALHSVGIDGLRVLTAGPLPPNPAELLNSLAMEKLLGDLGEHADMVIFDTPPILPVTDAQVLAPNVDGVVLVVEAGRTKKAAIRRAEERLALTQARLVGVALNKVDHNNSNYYYGGYNKDGYGQGPDDLSGPPKAAGAGWPKGDASRSASEERALAQVPKHLRDWEDLR